MHDVGCVIRERSADARCRFVSNADVKGSFYVNDSRFLVNLACGHVTQFSIFFKFILAVVSLYFLHLILLSLQKAKESV